MKWLRKAPVLRSAKYENGYLMDTNKVYAWQSGRNIVAINCTAVENMEAENLCQRSELDYLIWNDPTAYADLILNGDPQKYLRAITVYHSEELK